jgi:hypothetical protein
VTGFQSNGTGGNTDRQPDGQGHAHARPDDAECAGAVGREVGTPPDARPERGPENRLEADRQREAEGWLREALARDRRAELDAIHKLRYGCIGVIVLLVLLFAIGFVFF